MHRTLVALLFTLVSLSCSDRRICYECLAELSGTVFDFVSKKPIPYATVVIGYPPRGPNRETYRSDNSGNFSFRSQYKDFPIVVGAQHPGYRPMMGVWSGAGVDTEAGQNARGLQVPMVRSVQMSGRVTDEQGTAWEGCRISATPAMEIHPFNAESIGTYFAMTNSSGRYELSDLPADEYNLFAHCKKLKPGERLDQITFGSPWEEPRTSWLPVFYPNARSRQNAESIVMLPGDKRENLDFRLRSVTTVSVTGRLPRLRSFFPHMPDCFGCTPSLSSMEDDAGLHYAGIRCMVENGCRFRCDFVPLGKYRLSFSNFYGQSKLPVWADIEASQESLSNKLDLMSAADKSFILTGTVDESALKTPPFRFDNGLVPDEQISRHNEVTLSQETGEASGEVRVTAKDGSGRFSVHGLFTGVHYGLAVWPRFKDAYLKDLYLGNRRLNPKDWTIKLVEQGLPMRVVLGKATASLHVQVGNATDKPVDYTVRLTRESDAFFERTGVIYWRTRMIDLQFLPPGRYRLLVVEHAFPFSRWPRSRLGSILKSRATLITLNEFEDKSVKVKALDSLDFHQAALEWLQRR